MEQPADRSPDEALNNETSQTSSIQQQSINISHTYLTTEVIHETSEGSQATSEVIQEITGGIPKTASAASLVTESEDEEWFVSEWSEDQSNWTVSESTKIKEAKHHHRKLKDYRSSDLNKTDEHSESGSESDFEGESGNNTIIENKRDIGIVSVASSELKDQPFVSVTKTEETIIDSDGNRLEVIEGTSLDSFLEQGNGTVSRHESTVTTQETEGFRSEVVTRVVKTTTITSYSTGSEEQTVTQEQSNRTITRGYNGHESFALAADLQEQQQSNVEYDASQGINVTHVRVIQDVTSQGEANQETREEFDAAMQDGTIQEISQKVSTDALQKIVSGHDINTDVQRSETDQYQRLITNVNTDGGHSSSIQLEVDREQSSKISVETEGQQSSSINVETDRKQSSNIHIKAQGEQSVTKERYTQDTITIQTSKPDIELATDEAKSCEKEEESSVDTDVATKAIVPQVGEIYSQTNEMASDNRAHHETKVGSTEETQTLISKLDTDIHIKTQSGITNGTVSNTTETTEILQQKFETETLNIKQHKDSGTISSETVECDIDAKLEAQVQHLGEEGNVIQLLQPTVDSSNVSESKITEERTSANIVENEKQIIKETTELSTKRTETSVQSVIEQIDQGDPSVQNTETERGTAEQHGTSVEYNDASFTKTQGSNIDTNIDSPDKPSDSEKLPGEAETQHVQQHLAKTESADDKSINVKEVQEKLTHETTEIAREKTEPKMQNVTDQIAMSEDTAVTSTTAPDSNTDVLEDAHAETDTTESLEQTDESTQEADSDKIDKKQEETRDDSARNEGEIIQGIHESSPGGVETEKQYVEIDTTAECTDVEAMTLRRKINTDGNIKVETEVRDETIKTNPVLTTEEIETSEDKTVDQPTAEGIDIDATLTETPQVRTAADIEVEAENEESIQRTIELSTGKTETDERKTTCDSTEDDTTQAETSDVHTDGNIGVNAEAEVDTAKATAAVSTEKTEIIDREGIDVQAKPVKTLDVDIDSSIGIEGENEVEMAKEAPALPIRENEIAKHETTATPTETPTETSISSDTITEAEVGAENEVEIATEAAALSTGETQTVEKETTAGRIDVDGTPTETSEISNGSITEVVAEDGDELVQRTTGLPKDDIKAEECTTSFEGADVQETPDKTSEIDTDANIEVETEQDDMVKEAGLLTRESKTVEYQITAEGIDIDATPTENPEVSTAANIEVGAENEELTQTTIGLSTGEDETDERETARDSTEADKSLAKTSEIDSDANIFVDAANEVEIAEETAALSTGETETIDQETVVECIDVDATSNETRKISSAAEAGDDDDEITQRTMTLSAGQTEVVECETSVEGTDVQAKSAKTSEINTDSNTDVKIENEDDVAKEAAGLSTGDTETVEHETTAKGTDDDEIQTETREICKDTINEAEAEHEDEILQRAAVLSREETGTIENETSLDSTDVDITLTKPSEIDTGVNFDVEAEHDIEMAKEATASSTRENYTAEHEATTECIDVDATPNETAEIRTDTITEAEAGNEDELGQRATGLPTDNIEVEVEAEHKVEMAKEATLSSTEETKTSAHRTTAESIDVDETTTETVGLSMGETQPTQYQKLIDGIGVNRMPTKTSDVDIDVNIETEVEHKDKKTRGTTGLSTGVTDTAQEGRSVDDTDVDTPTNAQIEAETKNERVQGMTEVSTEETETIEHKTRAEGIDIDGKPTETQDVCTNTTNEVEAGPDDESTHRTTELSAGKTEIVEHEVSVDGTDVDETLAKASEIDTDANIGDDREYKDDTTKVASGLSTGKTETAEHETRAEGAYIDATPTKTPDIDTDAKPVTTETKTLSMQDELSIAKGDNNIEDVIEISTGNNESEAQSEKQEEVMQGNIDTQQMQDFNIDTGVDIDTRDTSLNVKASEMSDIAKDIAMDAQDISLSTDIATGIQVAVSEQPFFDHETSITHEMPEQIELLSEKTSSDTGLTPERIMRQDAKVTAVLSTRECVDNLITNKDEPIQYTIAPSSNELDIHSETTRDVTGQSTDATGTQDAEKEKKGGDDMLREEELVTQSDERQIVATEHKTEITDMQLLSTEPITLDNDAYNNTDERDEGLASAIETLEIQKEVIVETETSFKKTIEIQREVVVETKTSFKENAQVDSTTETVTKETISTNVYDANRVISPPEKQQAIHAEAQQNVDGDEGFDELHEQAFRNMTDIHHEPVIVDLQSKKSEVTSYYDKVFAKSKAEVVGTQQTELEEQGLEFAKTFKDKFKVMEATDRSEIDTNKPIYIFVLKFAYEEEQSQTIERIQNYLQKDETPDELVEPTGIKAAIRGSAKSFGTWRLPKQAVKIDEGYYALLINDFIPKFSQYKWLDMSASTEEGNQDPTTGFIYEPAPFVDRICEFQECKPGEEVAVVSNKWADYSYTMNYTNLEDWDLTQLQKLNTAYSKSTPSTPESKRKWSDIEIDVIKPVGAGIQMSEAVGRDIRKSHLNEELLDAESAPVESESQTEPPILPTLFHGKRELDAANDSMTIKKAKTDSTEMTTEKNEEKESNDDSKLSTDDEKPEEPTIYDSFIKFLNIPTSKDKRPDTHTETGDKEDVTQTQYGQQETALDEEDMAQPVNKRYSIESCQHGKGHRITLTEEAQFLGIDEGVISNDSMNDSVLDKAKEFFNIPGMSESISDSETKDISLEDRSGKIKTDLSQVKQDDSDHIEYKETKFTQIIRTEATMTVGKIMDMGKLGAKSPSEEPVTGRTDISATPDEQTSVLAETNDIIEPTEVPKSTSDEEKNIREESSHLETPIQDTIPKSTELDADKHEDVSFFQRIKEWFPGYGKETSKDDVTEANEKGVHQENKLGDPDEEIEKIEERDKRDDEIGVKDEDEDKQHAEMGKKEKDDMWDGEIEVKEDKQSVEIGKEEDDKRNGDIEKKDEENEQDGEIERIWDEEDKQSVEIQSKQKQEYKQDVEIQNKGEKDTQDEETEKVAEEHKQIGETEQKEEEDKQDVETEKQGSGEDEETLVTQSEERQIVATEDNTEITEKPISSTEPLTRPKDIVERVPDITVAETTTMTKTSEKLPDVNETETQTQKPSVLQEIFQIPLFRLPGAVEKEKEAKRERKRTEAEQSKEKVQEESEIQNDIDSTTPESLSTKPDLMEKMRLFFGVPEKASPSEAHQHENQEGISDENDEEPKVTEVTQTSMQEDSNIEKPENQTETAKTMAEIKEGNKDVKSVEVNFTQRIKSIFQTQKDVEDKKATELPKECETSDIGPVETDISEEDRKDTHVEQGDSKVNVDIDEDRQTVEDTSSDLDFAQKFKNFFHNKTKDSTTEQSTSENASTNQTKEDTTESERTKGRLIQHFTENVQQFLNVPETDNKDETKQLQHSHEEQYLSHDNDVDSFYTAEGDTTERVSVSQKADDETTEIDSTKTSLIQTFTEKVESFLNVPEIESTAQTQQPEQLPQLEANEREEHVIDAPDTVYKDNVENVSAAQITETEKVESELTKGSLIQNFTEKVERFLNVPEEGTTILTPPSEKLPQSEPDAIEEEENVNDGDHAADHDSIGKVSTTQTTETEQADGESAEAGLIQNFTEKVGRFLNVPEQDTTDQTQPPEQISQSEPNKREVEQNDIIGTDIAHEDSADKVSTVQTTENVTEKVERFLNIPGLGTTDQTQQEHISHGQDRQGEPENTTEEHDVAEQDSVEQTNSAHDIEQETTISGSTKVGIIQSITDKFESFLNVPNKDATNQTQHQEYGSGIDHDEASGQDITDAQHAANQDSAEQISTEPDTEKETAVSESAKGSVIQSITDKFGRFLNFTGNDTSSHAQQSEQVAYEEQDQAIMQKHYTAEKDETGSSLNTKQENTENDSSKVDFIQNFTEKIEKLLNVPEMTIESEIQEPSIERVQRDVEDASTEVHYASKVDAFFNIPATREDYADRAGSDSDLDRITSEKEHGGASEDEGTTDSQIEPATEGASESQGTVESQIEPVAVEQTFKQKLSAFLNVPRNDTNNITENEQDNTESALNKTETTLTTQPESETNTTEERVSSISIITQNVTTKVKRFFTTKDSSEVSVSIIEHEGQTDDSKTEKSIHENNTTEILGEDNINVKEPSDGANTSDEIDVDGKTTEHVETEFEFQTNQDEVTRETGADDSNIDEQLEVCEATLTAQNEVHVETTSTGTEEQSVAIDEPILEQESKPLGSQESLEEKIAKSPSYFERYCATKITNVRTTVYDTMRTLGTEDTSVEIKTDNEAIVEQERQVKAESAPESITRSEDRGQRGVLPDDPDGRPFIAVSHFFNVPSTDKTDEYKDTTAHGVLKEGDENEISTLSENEEADVTDAPPVRTGEEEKTDTQPFGGIANFFNIPGVEDTRLSEGESDNQEHTTDFEDDAAKESEDASSKQDKTDDSAKNEAKGGKEIDPSVEDRENIREGDKPLDTLTNFFNIPNVVETRDEVDVAIKTNDLVEVSEKMTEYADAEQKSKVQGDFESEDIVPLEQGTTLASSPPESKDEDESKPTKNMANFFNIPETNDTQQGTEQDADHKSENVGESDDSSDEHISFKDRLKNMLQITGKNTTGQRESSGVVSQNDSLDLKRETNPIEDKSEDAAVSSYSITHKFKELFKYEQPPTDTEKGNQTTTEEPILDGSKEQADGDETKGSSLAEKVNALFVLPKLPTKKESQVTGSDKQDSGNIESKESKPEEETHETDIKETKGIPLSERVKEFFVLPKLSSAKESTVTDSDTQDSSNIESKESDVGKETQNTDKETKGISISEKVKEFFVLPKLSSTKETQVIGSDELDSSNVEIMERETGEETQEIDEEETKGIPLSEKVREFFVLPKLPSSKETQVTDPDNQDSANVECKDGKTEDETKDKHLNEIEEPVNDQTVSEIHRGSRTEQDTDESNVSVYEIDDPDKPLGDKVKDFFNIPKDNTDATSGISDNSNEVSRISAQKDDTHEVEEQSNKTIFDKIKGLVQPKQTKHERDSEEGKDEIADEAAKEGDKVSLLGRMKEIFSSNAEDESEIKTPDETEEIQNEVDTTETNNDESGDITETNDGSGDKAETNDERGDQTKTNSDETGDITDTNGDANKNITETNGNKSGHKLVEEGSRDRPDASLTQDSEIASDEHCQQLKPNSEIIDQTESETVGLTTQCYTEDTAQSQTSEVYDLPEPQQTLEPLSTDTNQVVANDEGTEEQEISTEFYPEEATITLEDIEPMSLVAQDDRSGVHDQGPESQIKSDLTALQIEIEEEKILVANASVVSQEVVIESKHKTELHTDTTATIESCTQEESELTVDTSELKQVSEAIVIENTIVTTSEDVTDADQARPDSTKAEDDSDDMIQVTENVATEKETEDDSQQTVDIAEEEATEDAVDDLLKTENDMKENGMKESDTKEAVIASTSNITDEKDAIEDNNQTDTNFDNSEMVAEIESQQTNGSDIQVDITQQGIIETKTTKIEVVEKTLIQRMYGSFTKVKLTQIEKSESINNNENDNSQDLFDTKDESLKEDVSKYMGESSNDISDFWRIFFNIPKETMGENVTGITDTERKTVEGTSL